MTEEEPALRQFIFSIPSEFFDGFGMFEENESALSPAILAFKSNLNSAILVGSIPYTLTQRSVFDEIYNRYLTAEKIRSLKSDFPSYSSEDEKFEYLHKLVMNRIEADFKDENERTRHAKQILSNLSFHMKDEGFLLSSHELLRQVLVMTWGAFEALANDLVRGLLNFRPAMSRVLFESAHFRDVLGSRRNFFDLLERHGFDFSGSIGDVFCDEAKFDSLEKIREVAGCLFPDGKFTLAAGDSRLWRLSQQRHLIVHRRGIVDSKYLSRTGDKAEVGTLISFNADYVDECLCLVRDIGLLFAGEATDALLAEV